MYPSLQLNLICTLLSYTSSATLYFFTHVHNRLAVWSDDIYGSTVHYDLNTCKQLLVDINITYKLRYSCVHSRY